MALDPLLPFEKENNFERAIVRPDRRVDIRSCAVNNVDISRWIERTTVATGRGLKGSCESSSGMVAYVDNDSSVLMVGERGEIAPLCKWELRDPLCPSLIAAQTNTQGHDGYVASCFVRGAKTVKYKTVWNVGLKWG